MRYLLLSLSFAALSCTGSGKLGIDDADADTDSDADTDTDSDADNDSLLSINVEGSLDDRTPQDGFSAQTPEPYYYGLQRFEMLESKDDTEPTVVFDYAPDFVYVNMHDTNEVAVVEQKDLEDGTYTHFRLVLTHVQVKVDATIRNVPFIGNYPTKITMMMALSDFESKDFGTMTQGQGFSSCIVGPDEMVFPFDGDLEYPEPGPFAWAESIDGETWVTFTLAEPVVVSPTSTDQAYVMRFYIYEGFRWEEQDLATYVDGVWDIPADGDPEPVMRFGANAYEVDIVE
ncbi:MAG: hypothetical protein HN348_11850 [Proteobacteria bacterium]|nr:hypothetical protein [Pseudomonadota bacterium]